MVPVTYYLALSATMFVLGILGVLLRRNALIIFMSLELMFNAGNLAFVTFARMYGGMTGQIMTLTASMTWMATPRIVAARAALPFLTSATFSVGISQVSSWVWRRTVRSVGAVCAWTRGRAHGAPSDSSRG